jgi:hypothetical protein
MRFLTKFGPVYPGEKHLVQPWPPAYAKATAGEPGADHAVLPTAKGCSESSELEPEIARKPRRRRDQVVVPKKPISRCSSAK